MAKETNGMIEETMEYEVVPEEETEVEETESKLDIVKAKAGKIAKTAGKVALLGAVAVLGYVIGTNGKSKDKGSRSSNPDRLSAPQDSNVIDVDFAVDETVE